MLVKPGSSVKSHRHKLRTVHKQTRTSNLPIDRMNLKSTSTSFSAAMGHTVAFDTT